jgi:hypothetical protein
VIRPTSPRLSVAASRRLLTLTWRPHGVIHADDFQLVTPSGNAHTKTEYLGLIERGEIKYLVWEPIDIDARVNGDAGCVRYQSRLNIVVDGFEAGMGSYWHTDYYEIRQGRWQVVFSQATAIAN